MKSVPSLRSAGLDSTRSGSPPLAFDQHDVGLFVHLLDNDLAAVGRDVEVAHHEVRSKFVT